MAMLLLLKQKTSLGQLIDHVPELCIAMLQARIPCRNSNNFSLGICVTGDYRKEDLTIATKASIDELQEALVKDNIGKYDKLHHQMPVTVGKRVVFIIIEKH
ncbi:hypothetical protein MUN88_03255 [Gracilibacillus caseinilyticus]|uniref:Uncharacterized protein n=1 Tax=Gracilibacillus caseinilyticus TaxID=2932256 RepID=A0ABY4EZ86_9BACI|nr:hypothetical protein [Gracilibacillus caseinilyticus]UOQ49157.1 hypothetical protein MUN88_03255 [Gracilibacillus caseinilyticus]